jgi:hypothetical protein
MNPSQNSSDPVDQAFEKNKPYGRDLDLRVGELVEVRSIEEILETLDEDGRLDALPFMPEMLKFCGRRFTVSKRADKACDRIEFKGLRRMNNAVHFEGSRCDGQAHGGCQAGCLIYWKEAWLRRATVPPGTEGRPESSSWTQARLMEATVTSSDESNPDEKVFSCQATELNRATVSSIRIEDPRQYWNDVRSGNVTVLMAIRGLGIGMYNRFQTLSKQYLPSWLLVRRGRRYPHLEGRLSKTPSSRLDLQPGELVQIRSEEEILQTLDTRNRNRGLSFDVEMLKFCGRRARVLRRVDRIIARARGG